MTPIFRHFFILCIGLLLIGCSGRTNPSYISQGALEYRLNKYGLKKGSPILIRIFKEEKLLELWVQKDGRYVHFSNYPVCNYSGALGPKKYEGDLQSPEGFYKVYLSSLNPNSSYYKSFNLGYPNLFDSLHSRTGSYLMVHGKCNSVGCYAMTDQQIEEIYELVESALRNGQPYIDVHAFPFRMTKKRLKQARTSEHYNFWKQLEPGYTRFEKKQKAPLIKVRNKKYLVN